MAYYTSFAMTDMIRRIALALKPGARLIPCLVAAIFVLLAPTARAATTPVEIFVQQNLDRGTSILNDVALTPEQRAAKFRALLASIMDSKRVALFTLGPYSRGKSEAEIQNFSSAFGDFITAVLQHDLASNPGETILVTGSIVRAPDDIIVTAKLAGSAHTNGPALNMGFRVRKNASGAATLVDLQVEGVSMALAQRSDFSAWLQQHHGDVAALSKELQLRAQSFREQDATGQTGRTALER